MSFCKWQSSHIHRVTITVIYTSMRDQYTCITNTFREVRIFLPTKIQNSWWMFMLNRPVGQLCPELFALRFWLLIMSANTCWWSITNISVMYLHKHIVCTCCTNVVRCLKGKRTLDVSIPQNDRHISHVGLSKTMQVHKLCSVTTMEAEWPQLMTIQGEKKCCSTDSV